MKKSFTLLLFMTLLFISASAQNVWEFDFPPSVQNEKVFYDSTLWADFVAEPKIVEVVERLQELDVFVNSNKGLELHKSNCEQ